VLAFEVRHTCRIQYKYLNRMLGPLTLQYCFEITSWNFSDEVHLKVVFDPAFSFQVASFESLPEIGGHLLSRTNLLSAEQSKNVKTKQ
jgi:hypothetical protein